MSDLETLHVGACHSHVCMSCVKPTALTAACQARNSLLHASAVFKTSMRICMPAYTLIHYAHMAPVQCTERWFAPVHCRPWWLLRCPASLSSVECTAISLCSALRQMLLHIGVCLRNETNACFCHLHARTALIRTSPSRCQPSVLMARSADMILPYVVA